MGCQGKCGVRQFSTAEALDDLNPAQMIGDQFVLGQY